MRIRDKIIAILLPAMLVTILIMNVIFLFYFDSYLKNQEGQQIASACDNLYAYINERLSIYAGAAKDWGHRNDTYQYLNNQKPEYAKENFVKSTFINLDLSFVILLTQDDSIFYQKYYDYSRGLFTEFPQGFEEDFGHVIQDAAHAEDTSAIYRLGDAFYFAVSTEVTDSFMWKPANGKLIIGRKFDKDTQAYLESIAGGELTAIDMVTLDAQAASPAQTPYSYQISPNTKMTELHYTYLLPHLYDTQSIAFTFSWPRTMYSSGMQELHVFLLISVVAILCITSILFTILSTYITKPFVKLLNQIKGIDLSGKEIQRIPVKGRDEFAFLGSTLNSMLVKIETEQSKVKSHQEKLLATLLSVGDGVIVIDRDHKIQLINPVAQKLTGWPKEDALGEDFETVFNIINEFTREKVPCPVKEVFKNECIVELSNDTSLIARDGIERSIEDTAAPVRDENGAVVGCIIVFRDFSEKKEKQKKIEYLNYHDQLTGLYNRRYFDEEIKRLDTKRNLPISFVYADVNGLKTINDAFGHQTGDEMIHRVAEVFMTECRADDIIARTGGDEFIMLLPKTDPAAVESLVKRIRQEIEAQEIMGVNISLSFGWNTKTNEKQAVREILKLAEDHMYKKKILSNNSRRGKVIKSILDTLHKKFPWEEAHSKRVSLLCEKIGRACHLSDDELVELRTVGRLHDIGKIAIDQSILNKKGKLSDVEWSNVHNHPETGYRILKTTSEYYHIAEYVLAHHERWDGTGYPKGLAGEDIHRNARIIAIVDAYDAMTCTRPYRKAMSREAAVAEIKKNAGTQFDPHIAKVFVEKVLEMPW